jgi:uncharacterized protein YunC (DUF1805 family)
VEPYLNNFIKIEVPQEKRERIKQFVNLVIAEKRQEEHHKIDCHNEYKRFYTGTLGEAAIEELLGVELIDWGIGNSNVYNDADLRKIGINVGVKTVEYGKFPVVHIKPKRPELILLKINDKSVYVCGYANVRVLKTYQDIDLILSPSLKARGTKTGFYGFNKLQLITNLGVLNVCASVKHY